ncbi:zinc finger protein 436-like isoform X1 [Erythrolamprus reginae]|uniref:zinc finger protein 436-like isoform X1 n=1 Tax=Erythrolamprus reginae TaxID=121349 RepID=UPI00396CFC9C
MSLQYIKDDKGKDQLLYKGYLYKKVRASGDKTFWKCAEYHKYCCTGRAHTSHNQVIKSLPHLHPPTGMPTEADQMPYGMKNITIAVAAMNTGTCNALSEVRTNHPSQTIQRLRACLTTTHQHSSNLQEPFTAVDTTIKEPMIPSALTSPGFHEFTNISMDRTYLPNPSLCKEKYALNSPSIQAIREAGRQRFRLSTLLPGETLQEILSRLSSTAVQWLCPQEYSKDQIVDMVILEQFLSVLPVDLQMWLKTQEPGSSKEAIRLAMAYHKQEPAKPTQDMITFEDVSIHFTEEEWTLLDHKEKNLYWNVLHQNYDNVACLANQLLNNSNHDDDDNDDEEEHEELQSSHLEHRCPKCGKLFVQSSALENHQKSHTAEKPHKCSECGKCFIWASHLERHRRVHTGERPFKCPECGESYSQSAHLAKHRRNHMGERPYNCPACWRSFAQISELEEHKKTHLSCEDCGKVYRSQQTLMRHQRGHNRERTHLCEECGKGFVWASHLERHRRVHTGERPFPCPICGEKFAQKVHLLHHNKTHSHTRPYKCGDCDKCFGDSSAFLAHQRGHAMEKNHKCRYCSKSFAWSSHLERHQRIHTGEKPYKCPDCPEHFSQTSQLFKHQRRHLGKRPYKCSECGRSFSTTLEVLVHQRTHFGTKAFRCSSCGKGFTSRANLLKHQRCHVKDSPKEHLVEVKCEGFSGI